VGVGREKSNATEPVVLEQAIKDRIKSLGLTAYAVGKKASISPTVIQRFVNGDRGLTLKTADKLVKAMDMVLLAKSSPTEGNYSSAPTNSRASEEFARPPEDVAGDSGEPLATQVECTPSRRNSVEVQDEKRQLA
jgi:transcriptional regulator with XRE-family HTH domain